MRLEVVLERSSEGHAIYRGLLHVSGEGDDSGALPVMVDVKLEAVTATIEWGARTVSADEKKAREKLVAALVRAGSLAELKDGVSPPRKISRWRAV
jgi:hypothetical protein